MTTQLDNLKMFVEKCQKTMNAYMWHSLDSAGKRRSAEKANYLELHESIDVAYKKIYYAIAINATHELSYSCKNVYRNVSININGKIGNLANLKHIVKCVEEKKQCSKHFFEKFFP